MINTFNPNKTYAIIIGISDYNSKLISNLQNASSDANLLYDYLTNSGGYNSDNLYLFKNEDVTVSNIQNAYSEITDKMDDDSLLLFFFSGHGASKNDRFYLPLYGYEADDENTFFMDDEIVKLFHHVNAKRVLFLFDCCNSGDLARKDEDENDSGITLELMERLTENSSTASRVLVASSLPKQSSWEVNQLKMGIFTSCLLNAFKGGCKHAANANIYLFDLIDYLINEIPYVHSEIQ